MKLKTILHDQILVQHLDSKPVSASIYIPETASSQRVGLVEARVVQVGNEFKYKDDVKVGDKVLVPVHFGTRMLCLQDELIDPLYIMYDGEDVMAIVEDQHKDEHEDKFRHGFIKRSYPALR